MVGCGTRLRTSFTRLESRPAARLQLQNQEQNQAEQQLGKLALVGTLPAIGALIGTALMLGLLIQWVNKGHQSWLMQNAGTGWEIPWDRRNRLAGAGGRILFRRAGGLCRCCWGVTDGVAQRLEQLYHAGH